MIDLDIPSSQNMISYFWKIILFIGILRYIMYTPGNDDEMDEGDRAGNESNDLHHQQRIMNDDDSNDLNDGNLNDMSLQDRYIYESEIRRNE